MYVHAVKWPRAAIGSAERAGTITRNTHSTPRLSCPAGPSLSQERHYGQYLTARPTS